MYTPQGSSCLNIKIDKFQCSMRLGIKSVYLILFIQIDRRYHVNLELQLPNSERIHQDL